MFTKPLALLALIGAAQAHMHLHYPPQLLGDNNPFTPPGEADPQLNYPYGCCGSTLKEICKGHLDLLDQPEGQPTATWAAGQAAYFSISGHRIDSPIENPVGGTHSGGSGQVGFSVDGGKTFKVTKTWNGNFPAHDNPSLDPEDHKYDFTVPADLPAGQAIFAWTWINREQEFNMNCAVVKITGGYGDAPEESPEETEPEQPTTPSQFTLQGCTCSCPHKSWSEGCECYDCDSPTTKRRDVERKALALHKRNLQHAEQLNTPHRRTASVAFNARPDMALDIDMPGSVCVSPGDPAELKYPNPGPDVEEKPGNDGYGLAEPVC